MSSKGPFWQVFKPTAKRPFNDVQWPSEEGVQGASSSASVPLAKKRMLSTAGEGVKTALKLLKECFDGVPVPGLKAAAGGILELIRIFENVTGNQDDLAQLEIRIKTLKTHIEQSAGHFAQGPLPQPLQSNASGLVSALNDMAKDAERVFGKSRADRTANHDAYKTMTQTLNTKLDRMIASISMDATRRIEWRVEEGFMQGQLSTDERLILGIPRAHARYDDTSTKPSRPCHPGTRIDLLQIIRNWINDDSAINPFFWLCGEVGVGKTTVAHTIAMEQDALNQLGASFFFIRDHGERRHPGLFASTLAYQLTRFDTCAYRKVADTLRPDPDIVHRGLAEQFMKLVVQPLVWAGVSSFRRVVIVIDGLDECSDPSSILDVLPLLNQHTVLRLRVLVTSRPHAAIVTKFKSPRLCHVTNESHFRNIDSTTLKSDVRAYLEWSLADIASEYQELIPLPWPSQKEIEMLVEMAGGLFVIASTYDRYIRDPIEANPAGQLKRILSRKKAVGRSPTAELDVLYDMVLDDLKRSLSKDDVVLTHKVLQLALLSEDGCCPVRVHRTLDRDVDDVLSVLRRLGSVVPLPDQYQQITFFHASFGEYIQDPKRCLVQEFLIEPTICHTEWAIEFLGVLIRAAEDGITGLEYENSDDVPNKYYAAATNLSYHLSLAADPGSQELQQAKDTFCNRAISTWMHMSLLAGWPSRSDILGELKEARLATALQLEDEESMNPLLVRPFIALLQHFSMGRSPATSGADGGEHKGRTSDETELEAFKVEVYSHSFWYHPSAFPNREWGEIADFAWCLWNWSKLERPSILPLRGIDLESLQKAENEITVYFPSTTHYPDLKRVWYPTLSRSFQQNAEEAVKVALDIAQSVQCIQELHPDSYVLISQISIEDIVLSDKGRPMIRPVFLRHQGRARSPSPFNEEGEYLPEMELPDWRSYDPRPGHRPGAGEAVWRFGCILYEMMTGEPPLKAYQGRMKTVESLECESEAPVSADYWDLLGEAVGYGDKKYVLWCRYKAAVDNLLDDLPVSEDLKGVLEACWVIDGYDRPSIGEIINLLGGILGVADSMEICLERDGDHEENNICSSGIEADESV